MKRRSWRNPGPMGRAARTLALVLIFFLQRGLFGLFERLTGVKSRQGEAEL